MQLVGLQDDFAVEAIIMKKTLLLTLILSSFGTSQIDAVQGDSSAIAQVMINDRFGTNIARFLTPEEQFSFALSHKSASRSIRKADIAITTIKQLIDLPEIFLDRVTSVLLSQQFETVLFERECQDVIGKISRMANLICLDLYNNCLSHIPVTTIANSPYMAKLTTLRLGFNCIHDAGAIAIANSPYMRNLTTLDLACNRIGAAGAIAIAKSPYMRNLTALDLFGNKIGADGARAIVEALRDFPHLQKLNLCNNHILNVQINAW